MYILQGHLSIAIFFKSDEKVCFKDNKANVVHFLFNYDCFRLFNIVLVDQLFISCIRHVIHLLALLFKIS